MADEQQSLLFEDPETPLHLLHLNRPLVFFDLETTGLDTQLDRIVQFAFIRIDPDRKLTEWKELVNPGMPIPPEASRVHGITDAMVADKPLFAGFAERISRLLHESDLAGFNAARFDVPFLQAEMERAGTPLASGGRRIIDAQVIFHKREPRDLTAAYRFYCGKELKGAHDALADVRATLEVLEGQLARYSDLPRDVARLGAFCAPADDGRWVTSDRKFYWKHNQAVIGFGKHKGNTLQWIQENYPDYLQWLAGTDLAEDTRAMLLAAMAGDYPRKEK
ncbi:MAG TPA: 3'-5' exonuclease [bacterium]|nr:3'-5' exonuclease [bacterium]HOZ23088.1 3'-5' exonuclease [bacterium]